ncbi:agamous-like MADS-box protein AGL29 [Salvia miltiorrhiza]|uniref:agamous-like MADS-box protein AGL29 n=1 Tax=Salvia miltiorrhiza TaxID=226208 RepID=UPI0025AC2313|nr:agamous-like MADS-box protein AGL29 [Salvia miltiorrhiza]
MAARQTRGRQRIPMRLIQNQDDLYASFSKRRLGLFKKASELSTLCGADVGVIVFSPTDNPFSFFSPTMDSVLDRYLHPDRPTRHSARAIDSHARARIDALNKRLDDLLDQKLRLKDYQRRLDEADQARQKAWWEETAVDGLDKEQVRQWTAWFGNFKARVEDKVARLRNGGSSSSAAAAADPFYRRVFAPQYRYYVSPEGGGGGSGQNVFPAAGHVDGSGGGRHLCPNLVPRSQGIPSANLCFPLASGVENIPSAAAGEEEAVTSNQGGS